MGDRWARGKSEEGFKVRRDCVASFIPLLPLIFIGGVITNNKTSSFYFSKQVL